LRSSNIFEFPRTHNGKSYPEINTEGGNIFSKSSKLRPHNQSSTHMKLGRFLSLGGVRLIVLFCALAKSQSYCSIATNLDRSEWEKIQNLSIEKLSKQKILLWSDTAAFPLLGNKENNSFQSSIIAHPAIGSSYRRGRSTSSFGSRKLSQ
jgi:hypothetical protein